MIEKIIQSDKVHPINLYKELLYPYLDDEQEVFSPLLVGITDSNQKYKITRPPIHRDFSIEYVYEGKGVIKHGDDVFEAKAHDAFILHPNTTHNYYSDPEQPWKKIWLMATGPLIADLLSVYGLSNTVLIPNYHNAVHFEKIFETIRDNPFADRTKIAFILHKLFAEMSDFIKKDTASAPSIDALLLKKFIDANLYRKISRDELVAHIHSSPSTVTRIFKKNYNQTPFDYVLNSKIELAKTYLLNSSYTIDDIASLLGFNNRSHLSSTFKKRTGMTPQEFRHQNTTI